MNLQTCRLTRKQQLRALWDARVILYRPLLVEPLTMTARRKLQSAIQHINIRYVETQDQRRMT